MQFCGRKGVGLTYISGDGDEKQMDDRGCAEEHIGGNPEIA